MQKNENGRKDRYWSRNFALSPFIQQLTTDWPPYEVAHPVRLRTISIFVFGVFSSCHCCWMVGGCCCLFLLNVFCRTRRIVVACVVELVLMIWRWWCQQLLLVVALSMAVNIAGGDNFLPTGSGLSSPWLVAALMEVPPLYLCLLLLLSHRYCCCCVMKCQWLLPLVIGN